MSTSTPRPLHRSHSSQVLFELAILQLFSTTSSDTKVVYIAPTKSLCSERTSDWKSKFAPLGWDVVELTGDTTSLGSLRDIGDARIVVTTPEKWDVVTRRWRGNEKIMDKFKLFW
jgi:replicative superfamily II helicase